MRAITSYLQRRGYDCVADDYYSRIRLWERWYQGYVRSFHDYWQYNGKKKVCRRRKSLGMAKAVSEDWANLALNEKVEISTDNDDATADLWSVLDANGFRVRANQLAELMFALGTAAFVERMDGDEVKIDYIRAGLIYPLTWENGKITECAFASERKRGKRITVYLNIHRLEGEEYVIENHVFTRNGETLTETELPEDVEAEVRTGSAVPRFQILRPNIVNNVDLDSPMGVSVYANAIDQLEAVDLVYDSYCNEFRLGKKRILVPMSMARIQMEDDGTVMPVFDDNDTEFYSIPELDGEKNRIEEFNASLRYEAHEAGFQTALNALSIKVGMGKDRYAFKDGIAIKTATEVISEKSDLYQALCKHELLLKDALTGLVLAICDMTGHGGEPEVNISFDDSIIEDTGSQRETDRQDVRDNLLAPWEYRMRWMNEDEETAKARAAEAGGEAPLGFGE